MRLLYWDRRRLACTRARSASKGLAPAVLVCRRAACGPSVLPLSFALDVLFQPATIHHDKQSGIKRALRSLEVDHAFLEPHGFCANRDRLIDGFACLVRPTKDVNQIDLLGHRKEIGI